MKIITLKLTDSELNSLDTGNQVGCMVELEKQNSLWVLNVTNVSKFRKFLNDEMLHYFTMAEKESIRNTPLAIDNIRIHNNLKSILSKLDLYEYYKWYDEPKERIFKTEKELISFLRLNANEDATDEWLVDNSYQLGEWKKLDNGDILHRWESDGGVQNDEPKQIGKNKCCTEDNMEFVDMPVAMECEEYRCSKCDQMYTIRIEVERFWDDIETGSYWETL